MFSPLQKKTLGKSLLAYSYDLAFFECVEQVSQGFILSLAKIILNSISLFFPLIAGYWFDVERPILFFLCYWFPFQIVLFLIGSFLGITQNFVGIFFTKTWRQYWVLSFSVVMPFVLFFSIDNLLALGSGKIFIYLVVFPVLSMVFVNLVRVITAFAYGLIMMFIQTMKVIHQPNAVVAILLLDTIHLLEESPDEWGTIEQKNLLLTNLEKIAGVFQRNIKNIMPSKNSDDDKELHVSLREIADAFRSYKTWEIFPKSDTREYLIRKIVDSLYYFVNGTWDSFDRVSLKKRVDRNIIRFLILLIVPWIVWVGVIFSPISVGPELSNYVNLLLVFWSLVHVFSEFDPEFASKVSSIKNIKGLFQ